MPRYKRTYDETELDVLLEPEVPPPQDVETLTKLRNMWEFAALYEWMHLFGSAVKLQPIDIEVRHFPSPACYSHIIRWETVVLAKF